jgi:hypothetical protein
LRQAVVRADGTPFDDMKIGRPDWIRMRFQDLGTKRKRVQQHPADPLDHSMERGETPPGGAEGRRFQAAQIFRCRKSPTCSSIYLPSYFAFSFGPFCCAAAGYFLLLFVVRAIKES